MRGALVLLNAAQPVPNYYYSSGYTYLKFDAQPFWDTDGVYDVVSRDRLRVPPALDGKWGKVKISVRWADTGGFRLQILPTRFDFAQQADNLSAYPACAPDNRLHTGGTTVDHCSETHPLLLRSGDYFRAAAWQQQATGSGGALNVIAGTFSLEVLG